MKNKTKNNKFIVNQRIVLFIACVFCFFGFFQIVQAVIVTPGVGQGGGASSLNNGLVGWWTFDNQDMTSGRVNDKSGNGNHGNLINIATSTFYTQGKFGQGFQFDGVNDWINRSASTVVSGSAGTVSLWVNVKGYSGQNHIFNSHSGSWNQITLWYDLNYIYLRISDGTSGVTDVSAASAPIRDNRWHNIVVTWLFGGERAIWVDGVKAGSLSGTLSFTPGADFELGYTSWAASFFKGMMDNVKFYNRALTASEISQLYKQGQATIGATQNPRPSQTTLDSGLVGYWTFNNQDMTSGRVNDKSGNGNHGNLINIATSTFYTQGKFGQGFQFDGVNDYVNVPASATLNNATAISASCWMYAKSQSGTCASKGNINGTGWSFGWDSSNTMTFYVQYDTVTLKRRTVASSFETGKWIHWSVTWDGSSSSSGIRIYKNGVEMTYSVNQDGSVSRSSDTGNAFTIGRAINGSNLVSGVVDDVRVWNRALSASEIRQLYNMGR
jgi:uncharacterized membrane protein